MFHETNNHPLVLLVRQHYRMTLFLAPPRTTPFHIISPDVSLLTNLFSLVSKLYTRFMLAAILFAPRVCGFHPIENASSGRFNFDGETTK
jgi:hypothetical protein